MGSSLADLDQRTAVHFESLPAIDDDEYYAVDVLDNWRQNVPIEKIITVYRCANCEFWYEQDHFVVRTVATTSWQCGRCSKEHPEREQAVLCCDYEAKQDERRRAEVRAKLARMNPQDRDQLLAEFSRGITKADL